MQISHITYNTKGVLKLAKFIKMPDELKDWNIKSLVSENDGLNQYKITRKTENGVQNAVLYHFYAYGESYNEADVSFFEEEAKFLSAVAEDKNHFTYLNVCCNKNEEKEKLDFYIVTEELKSFSEYMAEKNFTDKEIIEFGISMADILSALESKNIFHGNINPDNIFITEDEKYKLGGFSDFESKIDDLSFVSPEIAHKKSPNMTTDIYSVGMIMYYLSNNKHLPFESDTVDKPQAIDLRNNETAVPAPKNGSEKLKSIIVIACQPKSKNRWKNVGNLKNALLAVQNELPKEDSVKPVAPAVIPVGTTDFDGNVFEEYSYEDTVNTPNYAFEETPEQETEAVSVEPEVETLVEPIESNEASEETVDIEETSDESTVYNDISSDSGFKQIYSDEANKNETADDIISNDVFDDYDAGEIKDSVVTTKDYGNFFDDDNSSSAPTEIVTEKVIDSNADDEDDFENSTDDYEDESPSSKKRNIALIVISIIIILCALGFVGYCVYNNFANPDTSTPDTASTSQQTSATVPTTTAETEPPTTTQPTTVSNDKTVTAVVGYGYYYAKELLEAEGFTVEVGEYKYSTIYDEGYVIAQTPDGDTTAEEGSVVTLDVSLGAEEVETTEPETTANQPVATENNFIFANSNLAYLSSSEVESLSREDLNIALNEIYARRGRIFNDASLAEYFNSQEWYTPLYTSDEFSDNVTFNQYEQANVQLIVDVQKDKGYR